MNEERSFERFVADNVAGNAQGIPLPDDFYDDMHSYATTNGQRPEWLAFIKEPPMRTDSRVAVGSPTVRVMAILAATFLRILSMAAVGIGAQRLLAADGEIVVDQAGNGDYTTITEAVAAAADGDDILVMPGAYAESFTIDKGVTIRGEDRASVIVRAAPEDYAHPPLWEEDEGPVDEFEAIEVTGGPFGVKVESGDVRLESLTLQDNGVAIGAGSVTIDGVGMIELVASDGAELALTDVDIEWVLSMLSGSSSSISDSRLCLLDIWSDATIESSVIGDGCVDFPDKPAYEVTMQGGVIFWEASTPTLRDNDIYVQIDERKSAAPTIEDNRIVDTGGTAIRLFETGDTMIRGIVFIYNRVAILLPADEGSHSSVTIVGNSITGGRTGIALTGGSSQVIGNTFQNVWCRAISFGS